MKIKREFAGCFPKQNLLHAFRNSQGKIHLEFETAEVAENNSANNWNPSSVGVNTRVDRSKGKYQTSSIILKETDTHWSEEEMTSELAQQLNIQKDELTK